MSRVIEDPQEERRVIRVNNPNHFKRDTTNKTIKLVNHAKQYGLVFDKRVIDPDTKISYPFGYRVWSVCYYMKGECWGTFRDVLHDVPLGMTQLFWGN